MPRYWVPQEEVHSRLSQKGWSRNWLMGWRDIARATDERTVISTVFASVGIGNNLPLMFPDSASPSQCACLVGCLSSLILDYVARHKVGGTHLNFFIYEQLPVLPPVAYTDVNADFIVPRALELTYTSRSMSGFVRDLDYDGPPFTWDEARRVQLRAELDAWYARADGLTRDELRYILDPADVMGADYPSETFRVLKNNEMRDHGEFRTQRLVLEAWDKMERGELPCPHPYVAPARHAEHPVASARDFLDQNPLLGAGPLFESMATNSATPPDERRASRRAPPEDL